MARLSVCCFVLFGVVGAAAVDLTTLLNPMPTIQAAPKDLLWLPLGDSITWGCGTDASPRGGAGCVGDAGGYRVPLAWSLSQMGYNVSTMGTLTTGPSYVPNQWIHHEGHPGWRFDQIDKLLNQSFATSRRLPDVITIHLGTNDCGQRLSVPTIQANANSLLRHVFQRAPNATVYMASMIAFPAVPVCSTQFNSLVPGLVASHKANGMNVHYTPMDEWSGVCVGNMSDPLSGLCCGGRVHPTAAGYLRMASAFALSIAESPPRLAPAPPAPPTGTTGNGTCGATNYGGDCNTEPTGAWDAAKENITSLAQCVAKAKSCTMAKFVSFSDAPGNVDCSWYSVCDFDHLCEDCSKCGIGCPKYYPYQTEVL